MKAKEKAPDLFKKAQTPETMAHATYEATHRNQIEHKGVLEYLRIQRMNGHCPREFGFPGCSVDFMADKPELICSNPACEVVKQKKEFTPEKTAADLFVCLTIGLAEIDRTITEAEREAMEELEARKRDKNIS